MLGQLADGGGPVLGQLADGRAVGFHPHRIDDRIRASAVGALADPVAGVGRVPEVEHLQTVFAGAIEAFGNAVDSDDLLGPAALGQASWNVC
ncbi:hypothetical protein [Saccharopolyspora gloriosae]|uniref:hypothetical protein n=1 Tax=Saccharopolyspora gloriosae TaxID=455344 RepID=UPI001FB7EB46|nr:hypothetical protein [Saccharopolyspora gloriosae]